MENNEFQEDITELFESIDEAIASYGEFLAPLKIIECDDVEGLCEGWTWDGSAWHEPTMKGYVWLIDEQRFISHEEYRVMLHERTVNDTLQALRKIREGDTSEDWQAWLDKLDAYNKAIEDTQLQETYPDKVVYPDYPQR